VTADDQNIGFATGPRYRDVVFVVNPQRGYVNLGFAFGVDLADPAACWRGRARPTGTSEDVARPELRVLIERMKAR
jgi:hypothetical protein